MDLKALVISFKNKYSKPGEVVNLTLLPVLFAELIKNGLDLTMARGEFYQEIVTELYKEQSREMHIDVMDAMLLLAHLIPAPKVVVPLPVIAKPSVAVATKTDFSVDDIPNEDEEGDPLYTPPEDRLYLRPEDCAPMQYDEAYCARIGATKDRR